MPDRQLARLLSALAILAVSSAEPALARADCQFALGFAALHDEVPEVVGTCTSDEQYDPLGGDAWQTTTNGLLVWRKLDNATAFTDGDTTWIAGPFGLEQRDNARRLWWEPNPDGLSVEPPPRPGDRCHTAGLVLAPIGQGEAGVGHVGISLGLTNSLGVPCVVEGYVGAQLLDARGEALPTSVVRGPGYLHPDPGPALVAVPPGGAASFGVEWVQVPSGDEPTCPVAGQVAIIPPDEYAPLVAQATIRACHGGELRVTAVQAVATP